MENTNEITMNVSHAMQLAQQMVVAPGILLAVQIYQFVARQHHASQMKKTDWQNFDKFAKFCGYEYEVASIPLTEDSLGLKEEPVLNRKGEPVLTKDGEPKMQKVSLKELKKEEIKARLDAMGVHYCMMDNDFSDNNIKVYYSKSDKNLVSDFFSDYVKENLVSGEMNAGDLKNLLNDRVSIISVPDELEMELKEAMSKTDVSFASIQDLNLTDGKKQMYIPNTSTNTVMQLYAALRDGLIKKNGKDPGPIAEIQSEDLLKTATHDSIDDFLDHCDEKSKEVNDSFVTKDSKKLDDVMQRYEPLGKGESVKYIQDPAYKEISIDAGTLVTDGATKALGDGRMSESFFACRVPGYFGTNTRYLVLPKNQVFLDKSATRERYVGFVKQDQKSLILDRKGRPSMNDKLREPDALLKCFDPQKTEMAPAMQAPKMRM